MRTQTRQWIRLTKFMEELKKNKFPTVSHMVDVLRDADLFEGKPCACSERTLRRDIEILRNDYHAPIAFDRKKQGFYLTDPTWQFEVPVFNTPKVKTQADPKILRLLHDAYQEHRVVSFTYTRPNDDSVQRLFEPHILTLFNGIWYVRGIERKNRERRTYAIHRMTQLTITKETFKSDRKLIAETKKNGPFDFEKISNARLRVDADAAFFFQERAEAEGYRLTPTKDGSFLVDLPPITETDLLRFVLGGFGAVELLKPAKLRPKIITIANDIIAANK